MTKGYVGYIHQHDQRKSNQKRQTAQDIYKFDLEQKRRVHTICQALNHLDKFCMNLTFKYERFAINTNSCKKTPLRAYRIVCDNLRFMGWEKHMNLWKCQTRFLMFCFSKLNMNVHVIHRHFIYFLCLGHV